MNSAPFVVGDRVFNTGNRKRTIIGIITRIIDSDYCEVFWSSSDVVSGWKGTIKRDGLPDYANELASRDRDRIVRVKLSVRVPTDAREN